MKHCLSALILVSVSLSACVVTGNQDALSLQVDRKSASLGAAQLGENAEMVLARAQEQFAQTPNCETRKVALNKTRKAFSYQVCAFKPTEGTWHDAPVSEVVYHFIDTELIKVDVSLQADQSLLPTIEHDITHAMGKAKSNESPVPGSSKQWQKRQFIVGVREGRAAASGNVFVQLYDSVIAESAPWLTADQ